MTIKPLDALRAIISGILEKTPTMTPSAICSHPAATITKGHDASGKRQWTLYCPDCHRTEFRRS